MLVEVGKLTGVECLINTSLNGRGRPICNTFTDVRQEFAGTGVRIVNF
jgi:predicted NodU family carbamoyl transferase